MRTITVYTVILICFISSSALSLPVQTLFYEILGVKPTATMKEIKKAYRRKLQTFHPDKFSSSSQEEIEAATKAVQRHKDIYEVLSDPIRREKYNRGDIEESDYFEKWDLNSGNKETSSYSSSNFSETISALYPNFSQDISRLLNNRGSTFLDRGKYEDAITFFTKAIGEYGYDDFYYFSRGLAHAALDRHEEAIEDFNAAIRINPKKPAFYANRGISYAKLEQYDKALADLNTAIDIMPRDALALHYELQGIIKASLYGHRGMIHYESGNYKQAEEDLKEFFKLDKTYSKKDFDFHILPQNKAIFQISKQRAKEVLKLSKQKAREQRRQTRGTFFERCMSFF